MVEYLDIVDENDNVVGTAPRSDVHIKGMWHRAVYIFVFNSNGELFIQQRSDIKDTEPGLWDCSVTGHPSSGQDYYDAAVREAMEEIGVNIRPKPLFFMRYRPYRHHLWIYKAKHNGPFRLDPVEIKGGKFILLNKLEADMKEHPERYSPEFIVVFRRFNGL